MHVQDITDRIRRLSRLPKRPRERLPDPPPANPIPEAVGRGVPVDSDGISWPLIEQANARLYYDITRTVTSSDGLFTVEYRNIESTAFTDADGGGGAVFFDDPDD